jgi:hypothetical protein
LASLFYTIKVVYRDIRDTLMGVCPVCPAPDAGHWDMCPGCPFVPFTRKATEKEPEQKGA